ncbi:class I SAM-dependent methyltransferase [Proteinivorax hydrogeniformans]|uniref:Class I SAM-dependent methyltransferase n=1 Tax=Proteinivorax hydrogeniformans TaxID=1826727 RepID=A0AAU8HVF7_9FIRM
MSGQVDEKRIYFADKRKVNLKKKEVKGRVLDIGGGGAGVISQLWNEQVVAIDTSEGELKEAPNNKALKIVMDAKNLKFLDDEFGTVTSFFTMMYIKNEEFLQVFKEIYRVTKPGGRFLLWDSIIPPYSQGEKDVFAFNLEANLPQAEIKTGYGILWPPKHQGINTFIDVATEVGFKVLEKTESEGVIYLELQK